jgi:hypothetical protein
METRTNYRCERTQRTVVVLIRRLPISGIGDEGVIWQEVCRKCERCRICQEWPHNCPLEE